MGSWAFGWVGGEHPSCMRCTERVYLYDNGESGYGGHSDSYYGCRLERCKVHGALVPVHRRLCRYKISRDVCGTCKHCTFESGHYDDKFLEHPRLIYGCNAPECIRKERAAAYYEREAEFARELDDLPEKERIKIIRDRSTAWNETHERTD